MKNVKRKVKSAKLRQRNGKFFAFRFSLNTSSGFALLFAVLAASLLLSIGLSIFSLTIKELALSSSGRESSYAFYAADSGAECALYWDTKGTDIFATSTDSQSSVNADWIPAPTNPTCAGVEINTTPESWSSTNAETLLNMAVDSANGYCATVLVTKQNVSGVVQTTIDARGYNLCTGSPLAPEYGNENLVERGLEINY